MSAIATALKHMLAAGMPHEAIVAAVAEMEAVAPKQRTAGAIRQERYRNKRNKASLVTESDECDAPPSPLDPPLKSPPDPQKITPPLSPQYPKQDARPSARLEFEAILSTILDPMRVEAIVGVRRKKGAVLTAHAANLLVKALSACSDIAAAADEMVLRNWTSVKPDWMASRQHGPPEKGVFGAAKRIIESRANGPEIFPRNFSNVEQLPARASDGPGTVVEDVRSGIGRRFAAGNS